FGNNNDSLVFNRCVMNNKVVALQRNWKIVTTGNDGLATIAVDKGVLPSELGYLIVSNDPTFNSSNTSFILLDENSTHYYTAHTFSGVQYFTFGTKELKLNPISDTICYGGTGN